jgi:hypothetical protein
VCWRVPSGVFSRKLLIDRLQIDIAETLWRLSPRSTISHYHFSYSEGRISRFDGDDSVNFGEARSELV